MTYRYAMEYSLTACKGAASIAKDSLLTYPGKTHHFLNLLKKEGKLKSIFNQNIDGLAGRPSLELNSITINLHGDVKKLVCSNDSSHQYSMASVDACNGILDIIGPNNGMF